MYVASQMATILWLSSFKNNFRLNVEQCDNKSARDRTWFMNLGAISDNSAFLTIFNVSAIFRRLVPKYSAIDSLLSPSRNFIRYMKRALLAWIPSFVRRFGIDWSNDWNSEIEWAVRIFIVESLFSKIEKSEYNKKLIEFSKRKLDYSQFFSQHIFTKKNFKNN